MARLVSHCAEVEFGRNKLRFMARFCWVFEPNAILAVLTKVIFAHAQVTGVCNVLRLCGRELAQARLPLD